MALSKTTQDHDEIQQWAERRGGKPAEVASTERNGQTGILRIEFPDAPHANDSALKEISWDEFFEKFDASGLSLVYQEVTKEGAESNFNKLIHPDDASTNAKKGSAKKTSGRGSVSTRSAGGSPAKKAPAKKSSPAAVKKSTSAPTKKSSAAPAKKPSAAPAKKSSATPVKKSAGGKSAPAKKGTAGKSTGAKSVAKSASKKSAAPVKASSKKAISAKKTAKKSGSKGSR